MTERKWADSTPVVPFGGIHGSGNDKTQFQRIVELERDLAAAQEARQLEFEKRMAIVAENCEYKERAQAAEERAERAEAQAEKNARDARFGQILMRYIDRLSDPTDDDPLDKIVSELYADALKEIDAQAAAIAGEKK